MVITRTKHMKNYKYHVQNASVYKTEYKNDMYHRINFKQ